MERLNIPGTYPRHTQHPPIIPTIDEWLGIGYRPSPGCPVCKGAGVVHPRRGEQIVYAEVIPCAAVGCLGDSTRRSITGAIARQTFDNFAPVQGTEKALKAAKALATGQADFVWLLVYGVPGNGKSHLCNAIVSAVRDRGLDVRMVLAADLFSLLREAIEDNKTDQLLRRFKDIQFLAIDDYGVQYGTDWEQAKFDELMTSRFATAKPTVLITNRDLADLQPRVLSRFQDKLMARVCHNTAGDYRPRK